MKELNPRAQAFFNILVVELVTIAHSFKSDDNIIHTCDDEIPNDKYGVKHLIASFGCSHPEDAKHYRATFNRKMNDYKKANGLSFSNNSFVCELFRLVEHLIEERKLTMTLVGHGVSGVKHNIKGNHALTSGDDLPSGLGEAVPLYPEVGCPPTYADFETAAYSGLRSGFTMPKEGAK